MARRSLRATTRTCRVNDSALFWFTRATGTRKRSLAGAKITHVDFEVKTLVEDVRSYELSADGKKILLRKNDKLHIVAAQPEPAKLEKSGVDLSAWTLSVAPREEWLQMFVEAWRLERDYFYDRNMHGVTGRPCSTSTCRSSIA